MNLVIDLSVQYTGPISKYVAYITISRHCNYEELLKLKWRLEIRLNLTPDFFATFSIQFRLFTYLDEIG